MIDSHHSLGGVETQQAGRKEFLSVWDKGAQEKGWGNVSGSRGI